MENLPNIVIHACKNMTEKMNLVKLCAPHIGLCLFTFQLIASKQLNSLTTIDILIWLGGSVVRQPLWVQEVPGLIFGCGKSLVQFLAVVLCLIFCFVVGVFLYFVKKHIICHKILQFLLKCQFIAKLVTDYKGIKIRT